MLIPSALIEAKRDGDSLAAPDFSAFLQAYLDGAVEEYHMAAFLMAVVFRGLSSDELDVLVREMLASGRRLDLGHLPGPRVDKHSTGGVGDKVSLALAPLAAEMGLFVPMMSGRGLGHTGGTLDKLEAIPGFRTDLSIGDFTRVLRAHGCAMMGQTREIAPLDRRLYALRNATGTVPAQGLMAASIMSKKLAEDLNGLVLDVKVGSGAFLPGEDQALELARTMVEIGTSAGVRTRALLTAMDRPLGRAIGNAVEVIEAVACLRGEGPRDLRDLVASLAAEMAVAGGLAESGSPALEQALHILDSGAALERFAAMVRDQGGDARALLEPARLPAAPVVREVPAEEDGLVSAVDPLPLARAVVALGGGRTTVDGDIDPSVGIVMGVAPGERVTRGDPLAIVHARDEAGFARARAAVTTAVGWGGAGDLRPLVSHRVVPEGVEVVAALQADGEPRAPAGG